MDNVTVLEIQMRVCSPITGGMSYASVELIPASKNSFSPILVGLMPLVAGVK
jgi:hypothetical protein